MTTPALTHIDNTAEKIHSHDVIARITELERRKAAAEAEGEPLPCEDESELCDLVDLEMQCRDRVGAAWRNGVWLYRIDTLGKWNIPLAEDVDFAGVAYWPRVG